MRFVEDAQHFDPVVANPVDEGVRVAPHNQLPGAGQAPCRRALRVVDQLSGTSINLVPHYSRRVRIFTPDIRNDMAQIGSRR